MGRYAELQKAWDENREEFRRLKEEMEKNEDAFLKIDQEMEAMEQEPIKDSDVVVMFSSQFETDYVVCKITDQSREWVKEQMNNIAGMDEDALASQNEKFQIHLSMINRNMLKEDLIWQNNMTNNLNLMQSSIIKITKISGYVDVQKILASDTAH